MRSILISAMKALVAVVVVLVATEGVFYALAGGGFRLGNFYVADDVLGVRMIPGADMRQRYLGAEPVVNVHINAEGYRGPDFPVDGAPEIAVVGDSLTFGLGVNDDETYVHRLDILLGTHARALNYGVPSYGPSAKEALVLEILATRPSHTVVFALNLGRAFIAARRTRLRPTARDGRFVRPEERPAGQYWPLPSWLVRHSHLIDALRTWRFGQPAEPNDMRDSAKSRWKSLVDEAGRIVKERRRLQESGWYQLEGPDGSVRAWSSLAPMLRRLKTACDRANTTLVLLLLPKDLQVADTEWAKYKLQPEQGRPVHVVAEDLLATAKALSIPAVDVTPPLREASPGAFVSRDWHFSPQGHDVIARALHQTLIAHKLVPAAASKPLTSDTERKVLP